MASNSYKRLLPKLYMSPTKLETLISLVADTVRRFMQDRHTGRYL
jgi:hypothetical protein